MLCTPPRSHPIRSASRSQDSGRSAPGADDCRNTLCVIGQDRHRIAGILFGRSRCVLDGLDLTINTQDFRHRGLALGIAAFEVIEDLVGLDLLLVEDVARRALSELAKAGVPVHARAHGGREDVSSA